MKGGQDQRLAAAAICNGGESAGYNPTFINKFGHGGQIRSIDVSKIAKVAVHFTVEHLLHCPALKSILPKD